MYEIDFDVNGQRLAAKQSRREGVPLLLLHNNSGSAELFDALMEHPLLRGYRQIALDLPGHGASQPWRAGATDYSIPALARVLRSVAVELGSQRYAVLGHSLGGHVASAAAEDLPGLQSLLLLSAPPLVPARLPEIFRPDPTSGLLFHGALSGEQANVFAQVVLGARASSATRERAARIIAQTDPAFRESLGASVMQGELVDEQAILSRTTLPVALYYGTEDPFHHLDYYGELKLRHPSSCIVPLDGCGHCPHLDAPDRFAEVVQRQLALTLPA